jgi:hypothetical protein
MIFVLSFLKSEIIDVLHFVIVIQKPTMSVFSQYNYAALFNSILLNISTILIYSQGASDQDPCLPVAQSPAVVTVASRNQRSHCSHRSPRGSDSQGSCKSPASDNKIDLDIESLTPLLPGQPALAS